MPWSCPPRGRDRARFCSRPSPCGCPVIATRSTDAVGAVLGEGAYGKLTPPSDAQALADAIAGELRQRSRLPESTSAWVGRYRLAEGVKSHAEALDLRIA